MQSTPEGGLDRRSFVAHFSAIGLGGTGLAQALLERIRELTDITPEIVEDAEKVVGLEFTPDEREMMVEGLNQSLGHYEELRAVPIPNSVAPALSFDPVLPGRVPEVRPGSRPAFSDPGSRRPGRDEDVAFMSLPELSSLIRSRRIGAEELTRLYLDRLERHDEVLKCVVTLTEDLAIRQARRADSELARGQYRGPLHGIPWGAKDLLAVPGYPTTWGAKPYEDQMLDSTATVVQRLEEAGAILVAKLSMGALAWGDVWFGGTTRNPWNPEQGSSGSSAGPASATAAGLVGFSIGSETWGSIVSPATRCGVTGLRPTFGAVSRQGAMALSWSMDKLGPMCRGVEDCAMVFDAIRGPDGHDPTVRQAGFDFHHGADATRLRVGYNRPAFEADHRTKDFDDAVLATLRDLGFELIPVELPDALPVGAMQVILNAEAAAAFDEITRDGRDEQLVRQIANAWPNVFRQSRLIPAVEYVQANRLRTMLMREWDRLMSDLDVLVTPSFGGNQLLATNLTGHPAMVLPSGFTEEGTPVSVTFLGKLYGEGAALEVARAFQVATEFHRLRPAAFS